MTFIRTWRCGEVGIMGTRKVLPGGFVEVGGSRGAKQLTSRRRYHARRLEQRVGEIVYFHDSDRMDGALSIHVAMFGARRNGRSYVKPGDWIAYARPVDKS